MPWHLNHLFPSNGRVQVVPKSSLRELRSSQTWLDKTHTFFFLGKKKIFFLRATEAKASYVVQTTHTHTFPLSLGPHWHTYSSESTVLPFHMANNCSICLLSCVENNSNNNNNNTGPWSPNSPHLTGGELADLISNLKGSRRASC